MPIFWNLGMTSMRIKKSIHHGKVQVLTKFRRIRALSPLNRTNVRLLQTDDPVLTCVGVVVVHLLLLRVYQRDHLQPLLQPGWKPVFIVGNQSLQ